MTSVMRKIYLSGIGHNSNKPQPIRNRFGTHARSTQWGQNGGPRLPPAEPVLCQKDNAHFINFAAADVHQKRGHNSQHVYRCAHKLYRKRCFKFFFLYLGVFVLTGLSYGSLKVTSLEPRGFVQNDFGYTTL